MDILHESRGLLELRSDRIQVFEEILVLEKMSKKFKNDMKGSSLGFVGFIISFGQKLSKLEVLNVLNTTCPGNFWFPNYALNQIWIFNLKYLLNGMDFDFFRYISINERDSV